MSAPQSLLSRLVGPASALLALSAALTGCGSGSQDGPTSFGRYSNQIPVDNLSSAERQALQTEVSCAEDDCNPSVAMLIATTDSSIGACTASMIGPDLAVTNSHCIPEDLKAEHSACEGRIHLFFPGSSTHGEERAECSEVITSSELTPGEENPDYAFIRLKAPTSRPVLGFSAAGFSEGSKYKLSKVDPAPKDGHFVGTLRDVTCTPVYDTVLVPWSRGAGSAVTVFTNCSVIHGNSGSPILDEKGEIRGVIQATLDQSALTSMMRALTGDYLDGGVNEMGVGTNLGCVAQDGVLPDHEISKDCVIGDEMSEQNASVARRSKVLLGKVLAHILVRLKGQLPSDLDSVFEWEAGSLNTQTYGNRPGYLAIPKCFKAGEGWLPRFKNFFGFTKGSASVDLKMPYWEAKKGFNRDLQQDVRLSDYPQGTFSLRISFSPGDFKDKKRSKVTIKNRESGIFGRSVLMEQEMGLCKRTH